MNSHAGNALNYIKPRSSPPGPAPLYTRPESGAGIALRGSAYATSQLETVGEDHLFDATRTLRNTRGAGEWLSCLGRRGDGLLAHDMNPPMGQYLLRRHSQLPLAWSTGLVLVGLSLAGCSDSQSEDAAPRVAVDASDTQDAGPSLDAAPAAMDAAEPVDAGDGAVPEDAALGDAAAPDGGVGPSNGFQSGAEGWSAVDSPCRADANASYATVLMELNDLTWDATGGQSGGYLSRIDTTSNCFFLDAPAAFRGDLSAFAGGSFDFALRSTHATWTEDPVVVLVTTNGAVIVHAIAPPGTDWTLYSVPLSHEAFQYDDNLGAVVTPQDFAAALANVVALRLPGEWGADVEETVGFDSVELKAP